MTAPALTLVPPPAPPEQLRGAPLEKATREELKRALTWGANVSAPTWRGLMFYGKPIDFRIPQVPGGVVRSIEDLNKDDFAKDAVGLQALKLAEQLQTQRPEGAAPRSMAATRRLTAARGDASTWNRHAFLAATGPEVIPLLVAAGYLTPDDIGFFEDIYPAELDEQRLLATDGARNLAQVAKRAGHSDVLPEWLNDQLWTLMGEDRNTFHFQELYDQPEEKPQPGPNPGNGDSKIAAQFRPTPSPGSLP